LLYQNGTEYSEAIASCPGNPRTTTRAMEENWFTRPITIITN